MEPIREELDRLKIILSEFNVELKLVKYDEFVQLAIETDQSLGAVTPPGWPAMGSYIYINDNLYSHGGISPSDETLCYGYRNNYKELYDELKHNVTLPNSDAEINAYIEELKNEVLYIDKYIQKNSRVIEGVERSVYDVPNLEITNTINEEGWDHFLWTEINDLLFEMKTNNQKFLIKVEKLLDDFKPKFKHKNIKSAARFESFTLISVEPDSEHFKNFHEELINQGYIERTDVRYFRRIFENKPIEKKIKWIGPKENYKGMLFYFINQIMEKGIVTKFKEKWLVASNCFVFEDNKPISSSSLSREKKPRSPKSIREMDGILDIIASIDS